MMFHCHPFPNVVCVDSRSLFSPPPTPGLRDEYKSDVRERHRSGDIFHFMGMPSGKGNRLYNQNVLSVTQFNRQQVLC